MDADFKCLQRNLFAKILLCKIFRSFIHLTNETKKPPYWVVSLFGAPEGIR